MMKVRAILGPIDKSAVVLPEILSVILMYRMKAMKSLIHIQLVYFFHL